MQNKSLQHVKKEADVNFLQTTMAWEEDQLIKAQWSIKKTTWVDTKTKNFQELQELETHLKIRSTYIDFCYSGIECNNQEIFKKLLPVVALNIDPGFLANVVKTKKGKILSTLLTEKPELVETCLNFLKQDEEGNTIFHYIAIDDGENLEKHAKVFKKHGFDISQCKNKDGCSPFDINESIRNKYVHQKSLITPQLNLKLTPPETINTDNETRVLNSDLRQHQRRRPFGKKEF